eukprot:TRINITY_DN25453_c0_g1_i2.p2 TRINITY_DN25453_c0_g1~~TRINITY_DN25453_c0_g1_i2.p2  ORF type:complete len:273 (+),score=15.52 TRINITY_DN25453_c0_g1_i2:72-821(+)
MAVASGACALWALPRRSSERQGRNAAPLGDRIRFPGPPGEQCRAASRLCRPVTAQSSNMLIQLDSASYPRPTTTDIAVADGAGSPEEPLDEVVDSDEHGRCRSQSRSDTPSDCSFAGGAEGAGDRSPRVQRPGSVRPDPSPPHKWCAPMQEAPVPSAPQARGRQDRAGAGPDSSAGPGAPSAVDAEECTNMELLGIVGDMDGVDTGGGAADEAHYHDLAGLACLDELWTQACLGNEEGENRLGMLLDLC